MIAELGHYALVLALALALVQSSSPVFGARNGDVALMKLADAIASTSRAGAKTGERSHHRAGHTGANPDRARIASPDKSETSRPLEPAFVDATVSRLAVYLGPIAKIVAKRAAQQAKSEDEFLQIVASHIGTQDRKAFLREMGQEDS